MRFARRGSLVVLALLSINAWAQSPEQKLTVTGKLVRVMAIGGESTGWAIELSPAIKLGDKQVSSLQVRCRSASKLEKLENKQVKATGKITHQQGVETGVQPILEISSIKEAKSTPGIAATPPNSQ
jgi:hypothetical protein